MSELTPDIDPEWEAELTLSVTPAAIIETIFTSADAVHTGVDSCIDTELVMVDLVAHDEMSENYCRYAEQRYTEEDEGDSTWHDWTVELRLQSTYVAAHWRIQVPSSPADWEWCVKESEKAFSIASVLVGRRVRQGMVIEEPVYSARPPRTKH